MEALIEKYLSDVRSALPLARLCLLLLAFVAIVVAHDDPTRSLVVELLALNLSKFRIDGNGLWESVIVGDIAFAALTVFGTYLLHRAVAGRCARFLWKWLNLVDRVRTTTGTFGSSEQLESGVRVAAIDHVRAEGQRAVKSVAALSESSFLLLGSALILLVLSPQFTLVDAILGFVCLMASCVAQAYSFLRYLRFVLPFKIAEAALTGRDPDIYFDLS